MSGIENILAVAELEKELGEFYKDIIELEWDMDIVEFIECFWCEEENCFDI